MLRPAFWLPLIATTLASAQDPVTIGLEDHATGLSSPVDIVHCGDERLFVVEQSGVIRIVSPTGEVSAVPFLDIADRVNDGGGEQGLLGLAFDPGYAENGRFYVYYIAGTAEGTSRLSRFRVTDNPDVADPASEEILYTVEQPAANHNGGDLAFGPDGYLYISFGDGGSGNDPWNNGQTLTNVLGDILRIDVSGETGYTIPADNPWVGVGNDTLPEIWASGLRNPWRMGFDALTGDLWIGDVGQNQREEIDFWPAGNNSGPNFGWRCYEGEIATPGINDDCPSPEAFVAPVSTHAHGDGWCSIIGGRVYRGTEFPRLQGLYIYTDYCVTPYFAIRRDDAGEWERFQVRSTNGGAGTSAIGENSAGELFVANVNTGTVRRIVDQCPMPAPVITPNGDQLISTPADSYTWYLDGEAIPGAETQVFVPTQAGSYYVVGGFGAGCELTSAPITVLETSISTHQAIAVTVVPVPAREWFTIDHIPSATARIELLDLIGKCVHSEGVSGAVRMVLDVAHFRNGSYVIRLMDRAGAVLQQLPVQIQH